MISPEEFWAMTEKKVRAWLMEWLDNLELIKFGTIPGSYSSGRPTILFDGEAAASSRTYPYLSSYAPTATHRVALVRAGHTWLILGRVL